MRTILRTIVASLAMMLASLLSASAAVKAPNFAYPLKVEADAEARLSAALRSADGEATVRALIDLGLAKSAVSTDSLPAVLRRIEAVAERTANPATKAMLSLLQADIYVDVYRARVNIYDRRPSLGDAPSADFNEWSEADFRQKVTELADSALAQSQKLQHIPLQRYAAVVAIEKASDRFYPTLFDFAAYSAIDMLGTFDSGSPQISPRSLGATGPVEAPLASPITKRILAIYNDLVEFHTRRDDAPALVMSLVQRTRYVAQRTFDLGSNRPSRLFDILFRLYGEFAYTDASVEFLLDIPVYGLDARQKTSLYKALTDFAKARKNYFRINAVRNAVADLSRATANISMPSLVGKGFDFAISVSASNVSRLDIVVYRLRPGQSAPYDTYYNLIKGQKPQPVDTISLKFDGKVPFDAKTSVRYALADFGRYIFVPRIGSDTGDNVFPIVACSDLSLQTTVFADSTLAWVVNPVTGAPVTDAALRIYDWRNPDRLTPLPGLTNADGFAGVGYESSGQLQSVKDADLFSPTVDYYANEHHTASASTSASLLTDLGLYHLGDSVGWTAVVYNVDGSRRDLLADRRFRLQLFTPNHTLVDSIGFVTDDWGRASGRIALPTAGLTGNFQLSVWDGKRQIGNRYVMVSDYKLPTFQVAVDQIERPASIGEGAVVSGAVATFAGFPLADAEVKVTVDNTDGWWFWRQSSQQVASLTATTDADGRFAVEIPAEVIAASPWPNGYFSVGVQATSITGETQQATSGFNMGKPLTLNVSIPSNFEVGASAAAVSAVASDGAEKEIPLAYQLENVANGNVTDGSCASGSVASLLASLPSGAYTGKFWPKDSALADTVAVGRRFVVYRPTDTAAPVDTLLWVPQSQIVADADGRASLLYATSVPDAYIQLLLVDEANRLVLSRWLTPGAGMHRLEVALPEGSPTANLYLRAVKDLRQVSASVAFKSAESMKTLAIKFETFRDKATPGAVETLTLRTEYSDGTPASAAMMLDISNKAIDVLQPNPFALNFRSGYMPMMSRMGGYLRPALQSIYARHIALEEPGIVVPQWQTYGRTFFPMSMRSFGRPIMASMKARSSNAVIEEASFDGVTDMAMAAPTDAGGAMMDEAESEVDAASPAEDDQYRPSEIPLALFAPMLTSDAEGRVSLTYRLPDANTTWLLRAVAFDNRLLEASSMRDVVASKPLMASLNAPRFLRTADRLTFQAMAMNATDSPLSVDASLQVVNPADGKVLAATDSVVAIAPRSSAAISLCFDVPFDIPMVIVRTRAASDLFSDGEQVLLPVLASDQALIESDIFYIATDQSRFVMPLQPNGPDGHTYLQFTENPTWEVVSALPGLRQPSIKSSTAAAAAIFSAGVSTGLARSNPEIERFLRRFLAEDPKSMLEQNPDMKTLLIEATPWMDEAMNDTQRLQRLALILDRREIAKCLEENIHTLAKTQMADGGWAWTADYPRSSEWATTIVLTALGRLNALGFLPDDKRLNSMIAKAVAYLDAEAAKEFAKAPSADFTQYVYVRGFFPDVKRSTAAQRVLDATIKRLVGSWEDGSLTTKAVDAIILSRNGYSATARKIVESLRQYATSTPERGMWWQQLDNTAWWSMGKEGATAIILEAFASVGAPEVDAIRQWLVLQKTTTDWGSSANTTQVIASILTSGRRWTVNPRGTAIRIGSRLVAETEAEKTTGIVHQDISSLLAGEASLTIDRQANYPSYGAIVRTVRRVMADIAPRPCDGLSIEKSVTVFDGERWVAAAPKVGDRVRVVLTLHVGRDLDYVAITDQRPAALEPVEQLPQPIYSDGLCFYRENLDSSTTIFIDHLPVGTYILSYDLWASHEGRFSSGVATAQSQYNPVFTAHSGGQILVVE